jgi:hypothetical protein
MISDGSKTQIPFGNDKQRNDKQRKMTSVAEAVSLTKLDLIRGSLEAKYRGLSTTLRSGRDDVE